MNVSVVIPSYNSERTLPDVLEAVSSELVEDDQLIIVDDGSTDSSAGMARSFPKAEFLVNRRPSGAAGARNAGASIAKNGWIVFVDSDAVPSEGWRELLEEAMGSGVQAIQGVYGKRAPGRGAATYYKNYYYHYTFTRRIRSRYVRGCATFFFAVERQLFQELNGFDEAFSGATVEDAEFASRLNMAGGRILLVPDISVYHLRQYSLREFFRYEWNMMRAKVLLMIRDSSGDGSVASVSMASPREMIWLLIPSITLWLAPFGILLMLAGLIRSVALLLFMAGLLSVVVTQGLFWISMVRDGGLRGLRAAALTFPDLMLICPAVLSALMNQPDGSHAKRD